MTREDAIDEMARIATAVGMLCDDESEGFVIGALATILITIFDRNPETTPEIVKDAADHLRLVVGALVEQASLAPGLPLH